MRHPRVLTSGADVGPAAVRLLERDDATVIVLSGEIDLDLSDQLSQAARRAAARNRPVWIDVSETTFIDSSAMRFFVRLAMTERRHRRDVTVIGASVNVRTALQLAGIVQLLTLRDSYPGPTAETGLPAQRSL